jgi:hypothetical protein
VKEKHQTYCATTYARSGVANVDSQKFRTCSKSKSTKHNKTYDLSGVRIPLWDVGAGLSDETV